MKLQIRPCRDDDGHIQECDLAEADFISVYQQDFDGFYQCIGDLDIDAFKAAVEQFKKHGRADLELCEGRD